MKCLRAVAINMALACTSAMRLKSQKTKEWAGFSHQSHSFNPSHLAEKIKDSSGQIKERYTVKMDSDEENL